MTQELQDVGPTTHVAEVVQHGDKMMIPDGMDIDDAIALLARRKEYMEKAVVLSETFDAFPWDGAHALNAVLARRYGWVEQRATPGFFGDNPPQLVTIEVGPGRKAVVPWGGIALPNIKGGITTGVAEKDGRMVFRLTAKIRRIDEALIRTLFDEVAMELKVNSIYRGQVVRIRFKDDAGATIPLPEPKFIDPYDANESMLIYSDVVQAAVETNLFTPISRVKDCIANGISIKRGVLLGGTYGTGKTLAAKVAARLAAEAGITFVYVPRADELAQALAFAHAYQSPACVVFCEDIDRVMDGERDVEMDDILNIIDGLDTKTANILVVLTTNALDKINPAMLRPGRLDAVIEVTPPDAKAAEKLLRMYGDGLIADDVPLHNAGMKLAGTIPAVIAEVVKRAKLAELKRIPEGAKLQSLSEASLIEAAETMRRQLKLLENKPEAVVSDIETAMVTTIRKALEQA